MKDTAGENDEPLAKSETGENAGTKESSEEVLRKVFIFILQYSLSGNLIEV